MTLSTPTNRNRLTRPMHLVAFLVATIIACTSKVQLASASLDNTRSPNYSRQHAAFTLTMMGSRRGKGGNLRRTLDDSKPGVKSINSGRGQEITGVTLPSEGKIKGWAFGEDRTIACANVNNRFYAVDGTCPRCSFDLFKGKLLVDKDVWGPEPCVACPTCGTTYNMVNGKFGPEYKNTGLAGFVNTWAKTATINNSAKDAGAFVITRDEDTGRVFCRER